LQLHLGEPMNYASHLTKDSLICPGVTFTLRRMSLHRRIALTKQIRDLGGKLDFLQAGDSFQDKVDAALASREIDKVYLEWGLVEVYGLTIDGAAATPAALMTSGPEDLTQEIVDAIKAEIYLTESERKN
jgi:hypothetical protein